MTSSPTDDLNVYLVGGAVRNRLLGLPTIDRDWVVVGATAEDMISRGFKPIGKSFPVFLHPTTNDEYALARRESKIAPGYHGFKIESGKGVSLEEDLRRRDLTINAIAETKDGQIIDPFDGCGDIDRRILKHVSSSFVEDPVRILRIAKFAARFHAFGFSISEETNMLMKKMVDNGEVNSLVPERVWQELRLVLADGNIFVFLNSLHRCHALNIILPEWSSFYEDQGSTTLSAIGEKTKQEVNDIPDSKHIDIVRFALIISTLNNMQKDDGLGKKTIVAQYISRYLSVSKPFRLLSLLFSQWGEAVSRLDILSAQEVYGLYCALNSQKKEILDLFLLCCKIRYPKKKYVLEILIECFAAANNYSFSDLRKNGLSLTVENGALIGRALDDARTNEINLILKKYFM